MKKKNYLSIPLETGNQSHGVVYASMLKKQIIGEEKCQAKILAGEIRLPQDPINNFICDYCNQGQNSDKVVDNVKIA